MRLSLILYIHAQHEFHMSNVNVSAVFRILQAGQSIIHSSGVDLPNKNNNKFLKTIKYS